MTTLFTREMCIRLAELYREEEGIINPEKHTNPEKHGRPVENWVLYH
jgi:hypothetical protein